MNTTHSVPRVLHLAQRPIRIRQRAAAVVRRADGRVLLHRQASDDFWALPGGGIEPGESASDTIARELQEELGTDVAVGPLAFVVENFFDHAGESYHEIGLYLHASPLAGSLLAASDGPYEGVEGGRKLVFAWFPQDNRLAALDLRPAFLRSALAQPPTAGVQHIVHRDALLPAKAIVDTPLSLP